MEKYNVDFFINFFKNISEDKWIINTQFSNGRMCAFGHCNPEYNINSTRAIYDGLREFNKYLKRILKLTYTKNVEENEGIASINNGHCNEYQQSTPKDRILSALRDIKVLEQPKKEIVKVVEKVRKVYVTISPKVREVANYESKESILN